MEHTENTVVTPHELSPSGEALSEGLAIRLESCEINAWRDLYAAAPADFAQAHGLGIERFQTLVMTRCATIPFTHFNCVMNMGLMAPATQEQLDTVLARYRDNAIKSFTFYHVPFSKPRELPDWYVSRGFALTGGWDRIYRDNRPIAPCAACGVPTGADLGVETVTATTAREWAAFIDTTYGLPTSPWLLALVDRPGWHHYLLRQRRGCVAARSMYMHHDGMVWFGIDAPVPGVMAPSFDWDAQLCQSMVRDALALGAQGFVADIEAPSQQMDTMAYRHFASLGFNRAYFRGHYRRG